MDPSSSADKSRWRGRRVPQELRFDEAKSNLEDQEEKSSAECEANAKHWAIVSEGFPPGVTVDELKNYGRRRQLSHLRPQDNLRLEEGSLRLYKSEYKRRFLAYSLPRVVLPSEEGKALQNGDPSPYAARGALLRPQNNLFVLKDQPMESATEKNSEFVPFLRYERRKLLRRSTALRPEGEFGGETEVRREYVDHKNPEKARLIRNLPSLRLEGEHAPLTTEQRENFIAYLLSRRPVLQKKKTSLKMEGEFEFATEKTRSYVPHEFSGRPRLRKRSTSLKLEGEVEFSPEYRMSFVEFPRSRPVPYKPLERIRQEGELENRTETKSQFVTYENVEIPGSAKPENNLHVEGEMEINPEYRINFVDFPRERPITRRPFNQLKPEGNLEVLREGSGRRLGQVDGAQRAGDPNLEKELSYLSESRGESKGEGIPEKVESGKGEEGGGEGGVDGGRRRSGRSERGLVFLPECKSRCSENARDLSAKHTKEVKSNASSPRKKGQRDEFKTGFEGNRKWGAEGRERNSSVKRLREAPAEMIQGEVPRDSAGKVEERKKREGLRFLEGSPKGALPSLKEFQAFKVLDVKGQKGCQSLARDVMGSDKSTSDDENSTYRLEVSHPGSRSPGFHSSGRRVFPSLALDHLRLEEAEARAKQRAENYVKVVKSPEIANSLLEEGSGEGRWRVPEKLRPLSGEDDLVERSFVVLERKGAVGVEEPRMTRERSEREGWMGGVCSTPSP